MKRLLSSLGRIREVHVGPSKVPSPNLNEQFIFHCTKRWMRYEKNLSSPHDIHFRGKGQTSLCEDLYVWHCIYGDNRQSPKYSVIVLMTLIVHIHITLNFKNQKFLQSINIYFDSYSHSFPVFKSCSAGEGLFSHLKCAKIFYDVFAKLLIQWHMTH